MFLKRILVGFLVLVFFTIFPKIVLENKSIFIGCETGEEQVMNIEGKLSAIETESESIEKLNETLMLSEVAILTSAGFSQADNVAINFIFQSFLPENLNHAPPYSILIS